jgi:hypothetical protein
MRLLKEMQANMEWNYERLNAPTDHQLMDRARSAHPHDPSMQVAEYNRLLFEKLHPMRALMLRLKGRPYPS